MVRLLLVAIFFLNFGAFAHECEKDLAPLEAMRYRMLGFLKKVTHEIEEAFPAERYYRVGIGRATGPIVASLRESGTQAASLPLRANFENGMLRPNSTAESRFNSVLEYYLPAIEELKGKPLLLMIYDEEPGPFISFAAQIEHYLVHKNYPVTNVSVVFITRQDRVRYIRESLKRSFSEDQSRILLRPLALANELRHWLMDSLAGYYSQHEFSMNDVFSEKPLKLTRESRGDFKSLVADLGRLPEPYHSGGMH